MDPRAAYLSQKHVNEYKKNPQTSLKKDYFYISQHLNNPKSHFLKLPNINKLKLYYLSAYFEIMVIQNHLISLIISKKQKVCVRWRYLDKSLASEMVKT